MAQILVRNLEDEVKAALQARAKRHGRSTEEEVRTILRDAVREELPSTVGLGTWIAAQFTGLGLTDGEIPELRGYPVRAVDFDEL